MSFMLLDLPRRFLLPPSVLTICTLPNLWILGHQAGPPISLPVRSSTSSRMCPQSLKMMAPGSLSVSPAPALIVDDFTSTAWPSQSPGLSVSFFSSCDTALHLTLAAHIQSHIPNIFADTTSYFPFHSFRYFHWTDNPSILGPPHCPLAPLLPSLSSLISMVNLNSTPSTLPVPAQRNESGDNAENAKGLGGWGVRYLGKE